MSNRRSNRAACSICAFAAFCLVIAFTQAFALAEDATVPIDIPAQSLGQALKQLGRQTTLQLFFTPDLVAFFTPPLGALVARLRAWTLRRRVAHRQARLLLVEALR